MKFRSALLPLPFLITFSSSFAVELIPSVPGHFLFEHLEGADDFLLEIHFAVVGLFGFRAERVGE